MKHPARWLAGFATTCALACAQAGPTVDTAAEVQSLRAAALAYHDGAAAMDIAAVAALYAPDAVIYAPDTPTITGSEGVNEFLAAFGDIPGVRVRFELADAVVSQGGDLGYTLGLGEITMPGADGTPVVEAVRDFHVWRKDANGDWKLAVDIWNSPEPAADVAG